MSSATSGPPVKAARCAAFEVVAANMGCRHAVALPGRGTARGAASRAGTRGTAVRSSSANSSSARVGAADLACLRLSSLPAPPVPGTRLLPLARRAEAAMAMCAAPGRRAVARLPDSASRLNILQLFNYFLTTSSKTLPSAYVLSAAVGKLPSRDFAQSPMSRKTVEVNKPKSIV